MQSFCKFIYYIVLNIYLINFILFEAYAQPAGKNSDTASVASSSTISSRVSSFFNTGSTSSGSSSSSVVLDFDQAQLSSDLELNNSIPGILKYSPITGKKLDKIKANNNILNFSKSINHVLCNSPFDNYITVVFDDSSNEQYVLQTDGFVSATETQSSSEQTQTQAIQRNYIELDIKNPSDKFLFQQVGNIKCYKPKEQTEVVNNITIDNKKRSVECEVKENFVCYTETNGTYQILVAYLNSEDKWLKYTLTKKPESTILMDVSLMRTFDSIDLATIFADHSTPYDDLVFEYKNLKINKNETGTLKSETKGNLKFILEVKNQNGQTERIIINFEKHFLVTEGFKFHSIRSKSNYEQMMFTYVNDNVIHHEKYVKKEEVYKKEMTAINKYDLERTKTVIGRQQITDQNVLFYTTIVPDAVHQEIKISHHGRFKTFKFEKGKDNFVIFPNMEFYLSKEENHSLLLCENGESVDLVVRTISNNKRIDYIISTDTEKGNPLSIKAQLTDLEIETTQPKRRKSVVVGGKEKLLPPKDDDDTQEHVKMPKIKKATDNEFSSDIEIMEEDQEEKAKQTPKRKKQENKTEVQSEKEMTVVEGTESTKKTIIKQSHKSNDDDDDMKVVVGPIENQKKTTTDDDDNDLTVIEGPIKH